MDLAGSRFIAAPPAELRAMLGDPDILKACVPGCERLEQVSEDAFEGAVAAKIGPIRGVFSGRVTIEAREPDGWTIAAEGADAAAGSGRASGRVTLSAAEGGTLVAYEGTAKVEGKIAQLGPRLVSGFARQSIETFLANLARRTAGGDAERPEIPAAAPPVTEAPPLIHDEPAGEPAPTLSAPPIGDAPPPFPAPPTAIAPTAVPAVPDVAAIAAAETADAPRQGGGSLSRILLAAAIAIVMGFGVAVYFGFLQRPPG